MPLPGVNDSRWPLWWTAQVQESRDEELSTLLDLRALHWTWRRSRHAFILPQGSNKGRFLENTKEIRLEYFCPLAGESWDWIRGSAQLAQHMLHELNFATALHDPCIQKSAPWSWWPQSPQHSWGRKLASAIETCILWSYGAWKAVF